MIEVKDVCYTYEAGTAMAVNAIDHITTTIPDGQFIGLIGHTGSGKSTFVQMLNGLIKCSSGQILYKGEDINAENYNRRQLRSHVGLVFQYPEHQLFETDILTDVMFGPKNLGLSEEECRSRAEQALYAVGFKERHFTQSPFDLSGGQKRRAAIAGVLAMKPEVLILDEPTAGLDPMGRDSILDLVSELNRTRNITIVLVSHSMEDVARYVDRIMVMNDGHFILDGPPTDIFVQVDKLEEVGLSAPEITYVLRKLKARGLDIDTNALTYEEAAEEILRHRSQLEALRTRE
ncbi:MAG: energy-coupling factor transporter ATPase [Lachnospiraceae bacterium]|nr:energy-coupling factor transporter ATPase [Lachnospiraceae bacterium]